MVEAPQSFIVREECEKAASQNGFRRVRGEEAGWAAFGSTTAQGTIHLAAIGAQGPWFLALDHRGIIAELDLPPADVPGPGRVRHVLDNLARSIRLCTASTNLRSACRMHRYGSSRRGSPGCPGRPKLSGWSSKGLVRTSFAPA